MKHLLFTGLIFAILLPACQDNSEQQESKKVSEVAISESDFLTVPDSAKPWVYYWWLKGNVSKDLITRDLEEMHDKGIGGFLLFDSRGYHDDYYGRNGNVPVPLHIKHEFMSAGWREMVKFTMQEANRLGLKMSINLANTGGLLRGPWDMGEDGPKQLIWTSAVVEGPQELAVQLEIPEDKNFFREVAVIAVPIESNSNLKNEEPNFNSGWKAKPDEKVFMSGSAIDLQNKISGKTLQWDVPAGTWKIVRFGQHVIGEKGSVDILNSGAVEKYFKLMGDELLKDAGPLAGTTLTHFYNVSWEGGQPNWTTDFENEFEKFRGYKIQQYLPMLAGIMDKDSLIFGRFIHDYLRTVSDCFTKNCYEKIGSLCHENGIQWHSENGGPWPRSAPMFREADMLTFWGVNDMPQGEFWCSGLSDLHNKSNARYTAMAGHIYGLPVISVEAFTHMGYHWTKYPAYLKPFADVNFIDGANFFIWHTFTASPLELGKPGFEYFAGTHINPNVTWWNESGGFFDYLGRCQYLLTKGHFVADICSYVSNKNYARWGRGEQWNSNSELEPVNGYNYDLIDAEALVTRMSFENGRLQLPDGMTYKLLVVDLEENTITLKALKKIDKLAREGATVVLGQGKPVSTPGIKNYPQVDEDIGGIVNELWGNEWRKPQKRNLGKGTIYTGTSIEEVLKDQQLLPDFEGPFEYIHRTSETHDIYFVSGEGEAECTFRVNDRKPEIWDPVNGKISEAVYYRTADGGRTAVLLKLPPNGSVFVVFRKEADEKHLVSYNGPELPEVVSTSADSLNFKVWKSGDYNFDTTNGNEKKITAKVNAPLVLGGSWDVTFKPYRKSEVKIKSDNLFPWNEHSNPEIKYFAGTATYFKTFTIEAELANKPARLQLGNVHDICRVWLNGKDLGVIWTTPWQIEISDVAIEGINELKIEVTNCWFNRLIGDAGLPEEKRSTNTNVRLVPDRSEYSRAFQAVAATDPLMPSGLLGPVSVEFGEKLILKY